MTDLIKRALLGSREAQKEITAKGELLPCPYCGENMRPYPHQGYFWFECKCGSRSPLLWHGTEETAREKANTRPQLVTFCGECKHRGNEWVAVVTTTGEQLFDCEFMCEPVLENDFCSYGEPREEI